MKRKIINSVLSMGFSQVRGNLFVSPMGQFIYLVTREQLRSDEGCTLAIRSERLNELRKIAKTHDLFVLFAFRDQLGAENYGGFHLPPTLCPKLCRNTGDCFVESVESGDLIIRVGDYFNWSKITPAQIGSEAYQHLIA